jgi:hypothetical protein
LVQAVQKHPKMFTVGTITDVDEPTMSCTIKPEDGGEVVDKVPIRVMRHANEIGFSVVPKVGTEVIVMWLDEYRPTIFQIHEWEKIIVLDGSEIGVKIENGVVHLGKGNSAEHPVAWGDDLWDFLDEFRTWAISHTHGNGTPGPGPTTTPVPEYPPPQTTPDFNSEEVKVS